MRHPQAGLSRRGFWERSLQGLILAGLPTWYARDVIAQGRETAAQDDSKTKVSPNDRIVMGAIGVGSRGTSVMNDAARQKGVEFVAVCDVDEKHRTRAAAQFKGRKINQYEDFRELLAGKDIDAVTIATPDHWHAFIAVEAMKRGKQVYCEKPLALTVAEGKAVALTAKSQGTIFQTGSQQRSDARFRLACELVRNGRIGNIRKVETRIGRNPQGGPYAPEETPKGLNWDLWLGQTPKIAYMKNACHNEFRWWYPYSGGKMTDWGAHHNDIAQWALGKDDSGPVSVKAVGREPTRMPNSYNWHETFRVTYTYAEGTELICTSDGPNGVRFEGDKGWIFVSRGKIEAGDPKILAEPLPKDAISLYKSDNHMRNFLDSVRNKRAAICDATVGHRSVTVCHIGNIALILKRELKWDPVAERFLNDEEADTYLSRPMRDPWKLTV